ncbi:MAG: hypothetical protein MRZ18_08165, partial [Clostridiales bacterium]|nr:hypothetical protein [Clostridiales bacterium]
MKKKILAMLLATGMLVGLLAGCGGGTTESAKTSESETPASNQAEAPVTEEQSAAPAQEPASDQEEASTLEADEGYVYTGEWASYPLCDPGTKTLTMRCEFPGFLSMVGIDSYQDCSVFNAAEAATGVHIEFTEVSMMNASEQFSLLCAANDMKDIMGGVGS